MPGALSESRRHQQHPRSKRAARESVSATPIQVWTAQERSVLHTYQYLHEHLEDPSAKCTLLTENGRERERGGQLIDFKVSTHEDAPTSHKAHGCSQEPQALQKRHHVSLDWYFLLAFESSCACQSSVMVSSLDKEFHSFDDSLEATTQLPHTPLKEKGVHDTDATQRYQRPLHP